MLHSTPSVAIAILVQSEQVLLQLRDPIPTIVFPGHWGLFGGHIEVNETPEDAIWRELAEEIGYRPPFLRFFCQDQGDNVIRYVFWGPLTVPVSALDLQEGWDCGLLALEHIQSGVAYSAIAQQQCPIGAPHRKILLDFYRSGIDLHKLPS